MRLSLLILLLVAGCSTVNYRVLQLHLHATPPQNQPADEPPHPLDLESYLA